MPMLTEGQKVRGTYEVERFLGEGAFAEVYRVRHRFLGRQAMKVFKQTGMSAAETEDALGEAILLSRLGHPNIVRVFDADVVETDSGSFGFFTMEYVAGGSLEQFWKSHGARFVPVETVREIMIQVCRGLSVAHGEKPPIIHRDIKPQNILVGYDGTGLRIRASDFGLAKRVNPLTFLASARGTRAFKAPECFIHPEADSVAGDIWALGCTLYLLLTDRFPFPDSDEKKGRNALDGARPVAPSRLNPDADRSLDEIVARCLDPDPRGRYSSATAMLDALEAKGREPAAAGISRAEAGHTSKAAFGPPSAQNEAEGRQLADLALTIAKEPARLSEAADQLEEALNRWPPLRDEFEYRISLWRRGVIL